TLDGRSWPPRRPLPYTLTGKHRVIVRLAPHVQPVKIVQLYNGRSAIAPEFAPFAPEPLLASALGEQVVMRWRAEVEPDGPRHAPAFHLVRDGRELGAFDHTSYHDRPGPGPHVYTVWAETF